LESNQIALHDKIRRMKKWQFWLGVAGFTWPATERFLGCGQAGELHLADSRHRGLFCRCVGAGMEMALPARSHQKDSHKEHVPHHNHWLHGK